MHLDNTLRGHLVTAVVEILLLDAGYHVVPVGIERTLRELRPVDMKTYLDLAPPRLRSAPDLLVIDFEAGQSWLTEVKFRRCLHLELVERLQVLKRDWAPVAVILAVADPPSEWKGVVRHIRVFPVDSATPVDLPFLTHAGRRLQDVFPRLGARWPDETIQKAEEMVLRITATE
jgi:hypothetical protein